MSKACTKNRTRLKKDRNNKVSESKPCSDKVNINKDIVKTGATIIKHGHGSKAFQSQELGCGDITDLHLCSQETLLTFSQDVDGQREVRWDCQSPETAKKLKSCSGLYSSHDIKKLVADFGDSPNDPLLHSVRVCLPSKDVVLTRYSRFQKEKGKVSKRTKGRVQNRDSVQLMIESLHNQASMPETDFKNGQCSPDAPIDDFTEGDAISVDETYNEHLEGLVDGDNCWSDEELFKDNSFLIEATQNPEKFLNDQQNVSAVPQHCTSGLKHPVKKISNLVPEDCLILSNGPQKNESLVHEALFSDSFVIPPSCTSKQTSVYASKTFVNVPNSTVSSSANTNYKNVNKITNFQRKGIAYNCTSATTIVNGCANRLGHSKNTTNFVHDSKPQGITTSRVDSNMTASKNNILKNAECRNVSNSLCQNSQSVIVNPLPKATFKTSFRKFNSFQVNGSSSLSGTGNTSVGRQENSNSNLNSSFRKTLSFDSSFTTSNHSYKTNKQSTPGFSECKVKPESTLAGINIKCVPDNITKLKPTELQLPKAPCVSPMQEDGFDVSLPDDVFQTLLEVDEIMGSQANIISTTANNSFLNICDKKSEKFNVAANVTKQVSNVNSVKSNTLVPGNVIASAAVTSTASCETANLTVKKNSKNRFCDIPESNDKQLNILKPTNTLLSPVRTTVSFKNKQGVNANSPTCAYFKKTFSLQTITDSPRRLRTLKQSLPSSSTPVKFSKNDESQYAEDRDTIAVKECSASFLDGAFDDSFTNDQALFESQILPVLEKLEAEAIQTQRGPASPVKCSSQEIEQKRQAALQKRTIKLSQMITTSGHK